MESTQRETLLMRNYDCIISIVVYENPPDMAFKAVRSCLDTGLNLKIYVVDNSPRPTLKDTFCQLPVVYHFFGENLGFGRAHNWVLHQEDACAYRLILNPDVFFESQVLPKLIHILDRHPDIGAIMPKVLNQDGSFQQILRNLPRPWALFSRRFLPKFFRKRWKTAFDDVLELSTKDLCQPIDVPYIPGCFLLVRSSVLEEVGGFDERFFMYMEDVDLCRRIKQKYRVVYHPLTHIYHGWQRQSYKSLRGLAIHIRSAVRYFNKWGWI